MTTTAAMTTGRRHGARQFADGTAGAARTALAGALAAFALAGCGGGKEAPAAGASAPPPAHGASASAKPALTVTVTSARQESWPRTLSANGSVAAWQESIVSAEQGGYRIAEVGVNVGDKVRRGQVLARMAVDTVQVELAQTRAALAEAEATLADAQANAERARQLQTTGAISAQQINQYLTAEKTARARLQAAKARLQSDELRLSKTTVPAPDDGVISARAATVGAVPAPSQELFRLIRGGRLEWRAELTAAEMAQVQPGMKAALVLADGRRAEGRVRMVAPTVDPQTRNGLVYVDLPAGAAGVRAGMFARGEFELGRAPALTLPQSAVALRDGFQFVYVVDGQSRVVQRKVTLGRRAGDRLELLSGLEPSLRVVASGVGFLADGDLVTVTSAPPGPASAPAAAASR